MRKALPLLFLLTAFVGNASGEGAAAWPPKGAGGCEWIDKSTGHRGVLLSRREGASWGFYFHQNPFTESGDKMAFMGAMDKGRCAFTIDLKSREIRQVTSVDTNFEVVAPKGRVLYYISGDSVLSTQLDSLETREVAKIPHHYTFGRGLSVNGDETVLAGCYCLGEEKYYQSGMPRDEWIKAIWKAKLPNAIYTIDIATGRINEFYHENEWLGHVQFSPTAPTLIEFCHEGPGHELDRMWMIRSDGTGLRKAYEKKCRQELNTHEFWTPDGSKIWSDFQTPCALAKALPFFYALTFPRFHLASVDARTLEMKRFPVKMRHASRHFNISPDETMFCGDGEGGRFCLCPSRKWIFLYRIDGDKLRVSKLCSMAGHNWKTGPEPNVHFTPDGKWIVFQSDVTGVSQVYAVEVARSQ